VSHGKCSPTAYNADRGEREVGAQPPANPDESKPLAEARLKRPSPFLEPTGNANTADALFATPQGGSGTQRLRCAAQSDDAFGVSV
jgi:hypothetical protein